MQCPIKLSSNTVLSLSVSIREPLKKIEMLIPEAYGLFELSVDRRGPVMLERPRRAD